MVFPSEIGIISALAACEAIDKDSQVQSVNHKVLTDKFNSDPYLNGTRPDITIDDASATVAFSNDVNRQQAFMVANDTSYLYTAKSEEGSQVSFNLNAEGTYEVRYFVPKIRASRADFPDSTAVTVNIGQEAFTVNIPVASHRGKMVKVGTYNFKQATSAALIAKPLKTGEPLVADAILMVPAEK